MLGQSSKTYHSNMDEFFHVFFGGESHGFHPVNTTNETNPHRKSEPTPLRLTGEHDSPAMCFIWWCMWQVSPWMCGNYPPFPPVRCWLVITRMTWFTIFRIRNPYKSKNFPTYPWNIPQTPNQRFMKEFLSFGALGIPGVLLQGYVGVFWE